MCLASGLCHFSWQFYLRTVIADGGARRDVEDHNASIDQLHRQPWMQMVFAAARSRRFGIDASRPSLEQTLLLQVEYITIPNPRPGQPLPSIPAALRMRLVLPDAAPDALIVGEPVWPLPAGTLLSMALRTWGPRLWKNKQAASTIGSGRVGSRHWRLRMPCPLQCNSSLAASFKQP